MITMIRMNLFVVLLVMSSCYADRLDNVYLPPSNAKSSGGSGSFLNTPSFSSQGGNRGFGSSSFQSSRPFSKPQPAQFQQQSQHFGGDFPKQANFPGYSGASGQRQFGSSGQQIPILKYSNENEGDGHYSFSYETGNNIRAQESGHTIGDGQAVEGSYSYISPEGEQISVTYTADENGFRASGAHLPTPPPIPEAILKSIEQNAREAAGNNGVYDDGSYRGESAKSSTSFRKSSFDQSGYHY